MAFLTPDQLKDKLSKALEGTPVAPLIQIGQVSTNKLGHVDQIALGLIAQKLEGFAQEYRRLTEELPNSDKVNEILRKIEEAIKILM